MTVLILGGTAEGRALARDLVLDGTSVVSSLAGRVSDPALPPGEVRIGGFGGPGGLATYLRHREIAQVVDATHPFAARMSAHAAMASRATGVPLLRLSRPGWATHPSSGTWHWVRDLASARATAEALGARPFLTTGRQSLLAFESWGAKSVLLRLVEPPDNSLPSSWQVIYSRGPYARDTELALLREHAIDVLVTKDSGGTHTIAKLDAAAELSLPVVILRRPPAEPGVPTVDGVGQARGWLRRLPVSI